MDPMHEILNHWEFWEPDFYSDILQKRVELPKDWTKIFYIARCLFSTSSSFPIKGHLAPLLERKQVFTKALVHKEESLVSSNMSESFDIGRITSVHQMSHILPREFITNSEDVFYKKLLNRELCKKEFKKIEGFSVSELVHGKEKELKSDQKIYILFDNSYSMNGEKMNKIFAAKAICLEYLRRAERENPQIYFRYFNQKVGPLIRITKRHQIKDLIQYIMQLHTYECFETKIADAISKAVADIRSDPKFEQAEILMITDGLGDIPANFERQLGNIKLHCLLISGIDITNFLKQYPDKKSWEKANIELGSKKMPSFWEAFLKITQVYRLQEITDIFIRIPSSSFEDFTFTNAYELDLIRKTKLELARKLETGISNREKFAIFQRLKFIIKYLKMMLSKEPAPDLKMRIKEEIQGYESLIKRIMKNKWFAYTLESQAKRARKRKDEPMLYAEGESKKEWIFLVLLEMIAKHLIFLPKCLLQGVIIANDHISNWTCGVYRKYRLQKRLNHINHRISKTLTR